MPYAESDRIGSPGSVCHDKLCEVRMERAIWISAVLVVTVGCNRDAAPTPVPIKKEPLKTAKVAPKTAVDYSRWHVAKMIPWQSEEPTCVAFSPDNHTIAGGGGTQTRVDRPSDPVESGLLRLWDVENGEVRLSLCFGRVALSPWGASGEFSACHYFTVFS